ncbi:hypothetical protein KR009_005037 [Drosophila setifemur]|nr:hypothetical protein KR009_005037 [Drosophila setifemur]
MHSHLIAVLLATVAISCCSANPSLASASASGTMKMFHIMSATSEAQRANPTQANNCFEYYVNVFDALVKEFEQQLDICEDTFAQGKDGVMKRYNPLVSELGSSAYDSCKALVACDSLPNSQDALNCYSVQASSSSQDAYKIGNNASISSGVLNQEIQTLNSTCETCKKTCSNNYEESSGVAYANLQKCLSGELPIPQPTTTTPEPTTTTTTPEPTTTTTTPEPPTLPPTTTTTTLRPTTTTESGIAPSNKNNGQKQSLQSKLDNIFKHIF